MLEPTPFQGASDIARELRGNLLQGDDVWLSRKIAPTYSPLPRSSSSASFLSPKNAFLLCILSS